ncbi:MAG: YceI family protein, partial [Bacteroidota bacterium]
QNSENQLVDINKSLTDFTLLQTDTIEIDLDNSQIYWKGTKFGGAGKHEGKIKLKSGFCIVQNNEIFGGSFIADMKTISVTDMPEHEVIAISKINNHLKSADFFEVERYPTSKFKITRIKKSLNDSIIISGNLTIKNKTKSIKFKASKLSSNKTLLTNFTIDRFKWDIGSNDNFIKKILVDRDIELTIQLKLQ